MRLPTRVVDYFCCIELDKETPVRNGQLQASMSQRFPPEDHDDAEFPRHNDLPTFCYPDGLLTRNSVIPSTIFSCVLTEANGARVYVTFLKYWEKLKEQDLANIASQGLDIGDKMFFPNCLILTSHWPFYDNHAGFLRRLHQIGTSATLTEIPIERFLCNYIFEIPLPPRGRTKVLSPVFNDLTFEFKRPPPNKPPMTCEVSLINLFKCLSPDNIAKVVTALLTEKRMLFVSDVIEHLNDCIEAICSLIYPFFWRHIYIPLLPKKLIDFVCAPMPFIVGILRSYKPEYALLEGVVVIDLDNDTVHDHMQDPIPAVIAKLSRYMGRRFRVTTEIIDTSRMAAQWQTEFRDDMLRFLAKTMRGYKQCLNPQTEDIRAKFNKQRFIDQSKCLEGELRFYTQFLETQLFQCFVDDRFDAISENQWEVVFFDEMIDRVTEGDKAILSFLQAETWGFQMTHKCPSPYDDDDDDGPYGYSDGFPILNPDLMGQIRPPPMLVTTEDLGKARNVAGFDDIAVEFFSQKRLFDRIQNSVSSRVVLQNKHFDSIHKYFRRYMSCLGDSLQKMEPTAELIKPIREASTSYERAIEQFREHIITTNNINVKEFSDLRVGLEDLYKNLLETPNICQGAFEAFKLWERETSQRKVEVERANQKFVKSREVYDSKLSHVRTDEEDDILGSIPDENVDPIIDALCRRDLNTLAYVEAATSFLAILTKYRKRTPALLRGVHENCKQRLTNFQSNMQMYVQIKRESLKAELASLDDLSEAVDNMTIDDDLHEFLDQLETREKQNLSSSMPFPLPPFFFDLQEEERTEIVKFYMTQLPIYGFEDIEQLHGAMKENFGLSDDKIQVLINISRAHFMKGCPKWFKNLAAEQRIFVKSLFNGEKEKTSSLMELICEETGTTETDASDLLKWWFDIGIKAFTSDGAHSSDRIPSPMSSLYQRQSSYAKEKLFQKLSIEQIDSLPNLFQKLKNNEMDLMDLKKTLGLQDKEMRYLIDLYNNNDENITEEVKKNLTVRHSMDGGHISRQSHLFTMDEMSHSHINIVEQDIRLTTLEEFSDDETETIATETLSEENTSSQDLSSPKQNNLNINNKNSTVNKTEKKKKVAEQNTEDITNALDYYSINLWGEQGLQQIRLQNAHGVTAIRDVLIIVDNLHRIWKTKKTNLKTHGDQSHKLHFNGKVHDVEHQCWQQLFRHSIDQSNSYKKLLSCLRNIRNHLRITKSELKNGDKTMVTRIDILSKNAEEALTKFKQCNSEKSVLFRSRNQFNQSYESQTKKAIIMLGPTRKVIADYQAADRKYKSAEYKYEYAKHFKKSIQNTKDICTAVIYDSYRDKEKKRQHVLQKVLAAFSDAFFELILNLHNTDIEVKDMFDSIQSIEVLEKWENYSKKAPEGPHMDQEYNLEDKRVFTIPKSEDGVNITERDAKNSMDWLAGLRNFIERRIDVEQKEVTELQKINWAIRVHNSDTLSSTLLYIRGLMSHLTNYTAEWVKRMTLNISLLNKLAKQYNQFIISVRERLSQINQEYNKAGRQLQRTLVELGNNIKYKNSLVDQIRKKSASKEGTRFWQKSVDTLQIELDDYETRIKGLEKMKVDQSKDLSNLHFERLHMIDGNVDEFHELEKNRITQTKEIMSRFIDTHVQLILHRVDDNLKEFQELVLAIEPNKNLQDFVNDHKKKYNTIRVPGVVLEKLKQRHLKLIKAPLNMLDNPINLSNYPEGAFPNDLKESMPTKQGNRSQSVMVPTNYSDRKKAAVPSVYLTLSESSSSE